MRRQRLRPSSGRSGSCGASGRSCRRSIRVGRAPRPGPRSMRTVRCFRSTVDQLQAEQLAAAQPVEHGRGGSAPPSGGPLIAGEEPLHLVLGPRRRPPVRRPGLTHLSGHADAGRRAAAQLASVDRVGERGAQHHPEDLDAPPGELPAGGEAVEPAGRRRRGRAGRARIAPSPASMCCAAHSYCSRVCPIRRPGRRPTARRAGRPCRGRRRRSPTPRTTSPPRCAERREVNVPSCRGRCLPVSVSMPSTRTTHLSRCCRTVGRPVGFHAMATSF